MSKANLYIAIAYILGLLKIIVWLSSTTFLECIRAGGFFFFKIFFFFSLFFFFKSKSKLHGIIASISHYEWKAFQLWNLSRVMRKIWAFLWYQNLHKFEKRLKKIGQGSFKMYVWNNAEGEYAISFTGVFNQCKVVTLDKI